MVIISYILMVRIIGLDASTTTIGISIIEYTDTDLKLIHTEYYKPDKSNGILDMLTSTRKYILSIIEKYNIQEFVIEDYVRFMKGASSASTVIPLAILNVTLRLAILDLGITPEALNVLKIRHTIKLSKKLPIKEEIPELVAKHLGIQYPWQYKINKRTKEQKIMVESYDMADSMAVAIAWILEKRKPKKKSRPKKKDEV